ncbi:DUF1376 domain-containing protein [Bradyrhizobium sp. 15]|nr:DUF1376 domain-containing protein [Bradyrhizobium sp. 15]
MPIHIGDYKRDTGHLRAAGHGAYLMLLFHHWSTGALPEDDEQLAAIACMSPAEWKKAKPILIKFFDEGWRHRRVEKDLESAKLSYEKRAKAGAEGGKARARGKQSSSNATAEPEQPLTFDQGTKEEISSLRSETRASRATRLPEHWVPSEADLSFAVDRGLSTSQINTEALKFRNHWTSKSGKDATKTNWSRTWENWILNGRGMQHYGNGTGNQGASGHDAILAVAARKARELDRHDPMAGPTASSGPASWDGADAGGASGGRGAAEADRNDHLREADGQRVREGEIIPPDKDAARVPRGRQCI